MTTPTPETDALRDSLSNLIGRTEASYHVEQFLKLAKKLERERDEARIMLNRANEQHIEETLLTNKYAKENDELKEQLKHNILDSFPVTEERVKWERLLQERDQLKQKFHEAQREMILWIESDKRFKELQETRAERDQLRKVADEMNNTISAYDDEIVLGMKSSSRYLYETLPHVQERNK